MAVNLVGDEQDDFGKFLEHFLPIPLTKLNLDMLLGGAFVNEIKLPHLRGFVGAIGGLLSPIQQERVRAEQALTGFVNPVAYFCFITCHPFFCPEIRITASALLKNDIANTRPGFAQLGLIKRALLSTILLPNTPHSTHLFNLVGIIGSQIEWPEGIEFLFRVARKCDGGLVRSALRTICTIFNGEAHIEEAYVHQGTDVVCEKLSDPSSEVRAQAIEAVSILTLEPRLNKQDRENLFNHIPKVIEAISECEKVREVDALKQGLEAVASMAGSSFSFLGPHFSSLLDLLLGVAKNEAFDFEIQIIAMGVILDFAEEKPSKFRKNTKLLEAIFPLIFNWQTHISEDIFDEDNEKNESEETEFGSECFDRLSLSLGGEHICPILFSLLPSFFSSQDWRQRRAALMSISVVGEGSHDFILKMLEPLLENIGQFCEDPHLQVRWAALNTLGQMSTDFQPHIQQSHVVKVADPILKVLNNIDLNPQTNSKKHEIRVWCHAAAAIVNLFDSSCPVSNKEIFPPALAAHHRLLSSPFTPLKLKETLVVGFAAIFCCMDGFEEWDSFAPIVKDALLSRNSDTSLRAHAVECIGHVSGAMEKAAFSGEELEEVMNAFHQLGQENDLPVVLHKSLCSGWLAMSLGLGKGFAKYLGNFFTFLVRDASAEISIEVFPGEAVMAQEQEQRVRLVELKEQGWQSLRMGDGGEVAFDSIQVEKKSHSISTLSDLIDTQEAAFFPVARDACRIFLHNLSFVYEDDIRALSAQGIPKIIRCCIGNGETLVGVMLWGFAFTEFLQAIEGEEGNWSCLPILIKGFSDCLCVLGSNALPFGQFKQTATLMGNISTLLTKVPELWEEEGEGVKKERESVVASLGVLGKELFPYFLKFFPVVSPFEKSEIVDLFELFLPMFETEELASLGDFVEQVMQHHDAIKQAKLISFFSKIALILFEENIDTKRDYVVEQLVECFAPAHTMEEVGMGFISVCVECSAQELVGTQSQKLGKVIDILASFILHPPVGANAASNIRLMVGEVVEKLEGVEGFKDAVSRLPLLKYETIQKILQKK